MVHNKGKNQQHCGTYRFFCYEATAHFNGDNSVTIIEHIDFMPHMNIIIISLSRKLSPSTRWCDLCKNCPRIILWQLFPRWSSIIMWAVIIDKVLVCHQIVHVLAPWIKAWWCLDWCPLSFICHRNIPDWSRFSGAWSKLVSMLCRTSCYIQSSKCLVHICFYSHNKDLFICYRIKSKTGVLSWFWKEYHFNFWLQSFGILYQQ